MESLKNSPNRSINGSMSTTEFSELEPSIVMSTPRSANKKKLKYSLLSRFILLIPFPLLQLLKIFQQKNFKKQLLDIFIPTSSKLQTLTSKPLLMKILQSPKFFSLLIRKVYLWYIRDSVLPSRKNLTSVLFDLLILFFRTSIRSKHSQVSLSSKLDNPNPLDTLKNNLTSSHCSHSLIYTQKYLFLEEAVLLTRVPPNNGWQKYVNNSLFSPWTSS